MTTTRARALRLRTIAVLSLMLFAVGAGGAAAYWTASDQLESAATAATVGITQTDPLQLAGEYNAGATAAAGTVTMTNTGSREAALAVTVSGTGSESLRGALTVRLSEMTSGAQCTAAAMPPVLAEGKLGLTYQRTLQAGASVTLCIRTALLPHETFAHAKASTEVSVSSTLTYATGADWTVSAAATVTQRVAAEPWTKGPQATCREKYRGFFIPYVELSGGFQPRDGDLRAYLVEGSTVRRIDAVSFHAGDGKSGQAAIDDQVLESMWRGTSPEAWILIEQKAGSEWRTVAMSKVRFVRIFSLDVRCG